MEDTFDTLIKVFNVDDASNDQNNSPEQDQRNTGFRFPGISR